MRINVCDEVKSNLGCDMRIQRSHCHLGSQVGATDANVDNVGDLAFGANRFGEVKKRGRLGTRLACGLALSLSAEQPK